MSPETQPDVTPVEPKNELPAKSKSFLTSERVKAVILAFLAVIVVVGNFFLEDGKAAEKNVDQENSSQFAAAAGSQDIVLKSGSENLLPGNAILRLESGDKAQSTESSLTFIPPDDLRMKFTGGHMWGNFTVSNLDSNIWLGNVLLMPDRAAFDLKFDGAKVELAVYSGDVYVGLWPEKDIPDVQMGPYDNSYINSFLVAQGNQVQIPLRKVTEDLRPLLPSKLAKELKYSLIPSADKDQEWIKQNLIDDQAFVEQKKQEYRSQVISNGEVSGEGIVGDFIYWSEKNLTFIPEKKEHLEVDSLFKNIDQALYFANEKNAPQMTIAFSAFSNSALLVPSKVTASEVYSDKIEGYINHLQFFGPTDLEYQVLTFLLQQLKIDDYELLGFYWHNVYLGLAEGQGAGEKALNDYYQKLESIFDKEEPNFALYLSDRNQLFDNILLNYPVFYRDGYFQMKHVIEEKLLENYPKGQLRDEVVQSFVARKIDFMKRLKKHFFAGSLEVPEAKKIFKRLITEAKDLLPKDQSSVAVIGLFQGELDDVNDFWGYLNTPEYQANFYGSTHEERYKAYLAERDSIYSFVNIQQDVFGEVVEQEKTIEEVMTEIETFFVDFEDISDLEIGVFEDPKERYVPITAVLGGYPFAALFDRDTGSVKEVYVYDELISDRLIKIDSLFVLLQEKFADLADDQFPVDEGEVTLESTAQRTARLYIATLIEGRGFVIDIDDVSVFDEEKAIYRIEKIALEDYERMEVSFDLLMNGEMVTHLFITIDGEPKVIDGEFTLDQLKGLIEAEKRFKEEGVEYDLKEFVMKNQADEDGTMAPTVPADEADTPKPKSVKR